MTATSWKAELMRAHADALARRNRVKDAKSLGEVLAEYCADLIQIERRATVERIREAVKAEMSILGFAPGKVVALWSERFDAILDEEAAR